MIKLPHGILLNWKTHEKEFLGSPGPHSSFWEDIDALEIVIHDIWVYFWEVVDVFEIKIGGSAHIRLFFIKKKKRKNAIDIFILGVDIHVVKKSFFYSIFSYSDTTTLRVYIRIYFLYRFYSYN